MTSSYTFDLNKNYMIGYGNAPVIPNDSRCGKQTGGGRNNRYKKRRTSTKARRKSGVRRKSAARRKS